MIDDKVDYRDAARTLNNVEVTSLILDRNSAGEYSARVGYIIPAAGLRCTDELTFSIPSIRDMPRAIVEIIFQGYGKAVAKFAMASFTHLVETKLRELRTEITTSLDLILEPDFY